jgi:hypothetical protein
VRECVSVCSNECALGKCDNREHGENTCVVPISKDRRRDGKMAEMREEGTDGVKRHMCNIRGCPADDLTPSHRVQTLFPTEAASNWRSRRMSL